jgi:hypothetical protein
MATAAKLQRWDHVLDEIEKTRKGSPFINLLVPGYKQFDQGFRLTVNAITRAFRDAWQTDRPPEGSALHAALEPIANALDAWDFTQPATWLGRCRVSSDYPRNRYSPDLPRETRKR